MESQHDLLSNDLAVTPIAQEYLLTSAKWGKFLAIIGFIGGGIMILVGVFFLSFIAATMHISKLSFPLSILGVIYVVMAGMMFLPCIFLFKFSVKVKDAILTASQENFELVLRT